MWRGQASSYSGDVLTVTITDELVASGQFLLAFLLTGADTPAEQTWLPVELRRVLQLPQTLRWCFVLRILKAWPREKCAIALGIPAETVDDESYAAAQWLARLAEEGRCEEQTL